MHYRSKRKVNVDIRKASKCTHTSIVRLCHTRQCLDHKTAVEWQQVRWLVPGSIIATRCYAVQPKQTSMNSNACKTRSYSRRHSLWPHHGSIFADLHWLKIQEHTEYNITLYWHSRQSQPTDRPIYLAAGLVTSEIRFPKSWISSTACLFHGPPPADSITTAAIWTHVVISR